MAAPNVYNEVIRIQQEVHQLQQQAQFHLTASLDKLRARCLELITESTKRPVIAYYSGWLTQPQKSGIAVEEADVQGFHHAVRDLDTNAGLDLILHTPGGDPFVAESIMTFLLKKFNNNIRVIVPQIAMSAGTLMACASREILMGAHASLGPIDPQFNGIPAQGVLEEFARATKEIEQNSSRIHVWQPILAKYPIAFLGMCESALNYTRETAESWLKQIHLGQQASITTDPKRIVDELIKLGSTSSHSRRLSVSMCIDLGLNAKCLATDKADLDPFYMAAHDAFMATFQKSQIVKIIQNNKGCTYAQLSSNPL